MIEVKLYTVEGADPKSTLKGSIIYDKGKLSTKPIDKKDKGLLEFIVSEPIITAAGDIFDPDEQPEQWLKNLYLAHHSAGLTASKPVETS